MPNYDVLRYSEFDSMYEDVLKKYTNSFPDDFKAARKTILGKLEDWDIQPEKLPKTDKIPMGDGFRFKALKTRMMIKEAQDKIGRLVWICDEERENIFLTEVYHKKDRRNHNEKRIKQAHNEYYSEYCQ